MHGSVKRGLIGLLATLLVLAGISVVGWLVFGLAFVEAQIRTALAEQGIPVRTLTLRAVGIGGAELADLDLDYAGGVTVETVEVEYRLSELIGSGRIDRLTVSGLRLDLTRLPTAREGADAGAGRDDGSSSFGLPVDEIVVRDGRIAVGSPLGAITVALDLLGHSPAGGGLTVSGAMTIRGESGEILTPFAASIAPDGAAELSATSEAGRLEWRGAAFELSSGALAAAGSLAGLGRIDGVLEARLTLPDRSTANLNVTIGLNDDVFTLRAATAGDSDRDGLEMTAAVQGLSGSVTTLDAELVGHLRQLSRLAALSGVTAGQFDDGRLTVRLSGRADRPLGGVPQTVDGRILVLGQGTLASGERGDIDMAAQFILADGAVRLTGERPLRFGWLPPGAIDTLATTFGDGGDNAFDIRFGQAGTGWTMALAGPFSLNDGLDGASGAVDLTTSLDWSGPDELVGPVQAELALSGFLNEIGTLVDGRLELAGDLGIRRNRWRFRPHGCVLLGARRLSILPTDTDIEGLAGCLEASSDEPMLVVSPGGQGGLWVRANLRAEPAIVNLDAGSPQPSRLDVELPLAVFDLGTGTEDEITVSGAGLTLHEPGIAFEDIGFIVDAPPDSVPGIRLDGVTVRSLQSTEWFAPVSVIGDASLTGEGALIFQGSVRGGSGALAAVVSGDHDTVSGRGRLEVQLDPVSFAPGIRQPADLAPILGAIPIADVTGSVDGIARLGWGDRLTSSGELSLEDLTLSLGGAIIRSIDGRVRADSLLPLSLPDGQLLALGGADFGLTLEEGALAFGLSDGDLLSVQGLGFGLAGGSLAVEPFQARLADQEVTLAITMQGVDLARLSQQFPAEGLSITGRMDGRIPLRLMGDTITVDNGVLESTEAGVIRYVATVPVGPPEEGGVALLITAVENFQYEALRATLDGRTGEDLDVAIRLTGANPELYDGFPIALNVNLSGALDQILLSGLRSLTIADEAGRVIRGE